ncbi:hypothetical protein CHS0354_036186 [Potamilus streckersoni]|uniref:Uncharacterized protein n=1 Tax=Potamilus streckersoni TaxID=2493646 RepID=A0AAE0SWL4_9BIVA|nr:hypothetical protein CHS0354_036186 [Potamilus streckersoni]
MENEIEDNQKNSSDASDFLSKRLITVNCFNIKLITLLIALQGWLIVTVRTSIRQLPAIPYSFWERNARSSSYPVLRKKDSGLVRGYGGGEEVLVFLTSYKFVCKCLVDIPICDVCKYRAESSCGQAGEYTMQIKGESRGRSAKECLIKHSDVIWRPHVFATTSLLSPSLSINLETEENPFNLSLRIPSTKWNEALSKIQSYSSFVGRPVPATEMFHAKSEENDQMKIGSFWDKFISPFESSSSSSFG